MAIHERHVEMTKKPGDLSGIIAPKGKATSETTYPGDDAKPKRPPRKTGAGSQGKAPAKYQYAKERRSDSLTLRLAPSERERLEALAERTGAPLTQVVVWGLEALENEIGDG